MSRTIENGAEKGSSADENARNLHFARPAENKISISLTTSIPAVLDKNQDRCAAGVVGKIPRCVSIITQREETRQ